VRGLDDTSLKGEAAPHTDFVSWREVRRLFREFASVRVESQNSDEYVLLRGHLVVAREKLLENIGRGMSPDLYIVAVK